MAFSLIMSSTFLKNFAANRSHIVSKTILRAFSSSDELPDKFQRAVVKVSKFQTEPENDSKLKLYALYKQSTVGKCNVSKPGMFDIVAKYKWEAWHNLGDLSKEDSMEQYIRIVEEMAKTHGTGNGVPKNSVDSQSDLLSSSKEGVLTVTINRPEKKNAITIEMYRQIPKILEDATADDNIKMVVLTGAGDYFSSGNDLTMFKVKSEKEVKELSKFGRDVLEVFVNSLIDFPKPIVAVVNGPAIGIMVTTLALLDTVICSDSATFSTPFLTTSQTPEGCSTITFPRILGTAKANAMLLFNEKLSAEQAYQSGFVSKVVPKDQLQSYVDSWLFGPNGLISIGSTNMWAKGKKLLRTEEEKSLLREINRKECETLMETWLSPDFANAMTKFLTRKK